MRDLDKALADIFAIRSQIAAGTAFRGYGPAAIAATGVLALLTAILQFLWLDDPTSQPLIFFVGWAVAALVSSAIIWVEMQARSRRHHSGPGRRDDPPGDRAVPARRRRRRAARGHAGEVRAGNAVDAAGAVAIAGQPRHFRLRPLVAATIAIAGAWYFVAGFAVLVVASGHTRYRPGRWACRSWSASR